MGKMVLDLDKGKMYKKCIIIFSSKNSKKTQAPKNVLNKSWRISSNTTLIRVKIDVSSYNLKVNTYH